MSESTPVRRRLSRRTAVVAVAATAALGGGVYLTGAAFTDQATVDATMTVGTVAIEADTSAASAPIAATGVLPGDTGNTAVTVENTGSSDVYYSVSITATSATDAELAESLRVTLASGGQTHTDELADLADGALHVPGALAAGDDTEVTVSYELPDDAPNSLQGTEAGFSIVVDAIQTKHQTAQTGWVTIP